MLLWNKHATVNLPSEYFVFVCSILKNCAKLCSREESIVEWISVLVQHSLLNSC